MAAPMDIVGPLLAAGAGAGMDWNLKRRRDEFESDNASVNQLVQMNRTLAANNEFGVARRARAMFARLHTAKYLKMDPLLKELFFPTLTYKQAFGFTSVSCINQGSGQTSGKTTGLIATDNRNVRTSASTVTDPLDEIEFSKPRGSFRGFACFTLRSSRIPEGGDGSTSANSSKLNTKTQKVAGSNIWSGGAHAHGDDIWSHFRRFFNGPVLKTVADSKQGTAQQVQMFDAPLVSSTLPEKNSSISVSEVGFRGDLEKIAARACPFVPSNRLYRGPNQPAPPQTQNTESYAPPDGNSYKILNDSGKYYSTVLNDNFRIADGYLELDITNGKVAPCLIEIVIHSFKKQFHEASASNLLDSLFKSIWQSVQMSQRQGIGNVNAFDTTQGTDANNDNMSGGWQAFYDPAYPLLKTKKSMDQHSDSIATEVHRSSHVLSPGQTKLVRINLGSLYYSLGGQTKGPGAPQSNVQAFSQPVPKMGPGSLLVSMGHSGFEVLSAPVVSQTPTAGLHVYPDSMVSTNDHLLPGAGFWVGKQHTASEVVVSGNYCEKFYPMTPGTNPGDRILANSKPGVPYALASGVHLGLPAMAPATNVVATTDANDQAYPSNNTSADRSATGTQSTT